MVKISQFFIIDLYRKTQKSANGPHFVRTITWEPRLLLTNSKKQQFRTDLYFITLMISPFILEANEKMILVLSSVIFITMIFHHYYWKKPTEVLKIMQNITIKEVSFQILSCFHFWSQWVLLYIFWLIIWFQLYDELTERAPLLQAVLIAASHTSIRIKAGPSQISQPMIVTAAAICLKNRSKTTTSVQLMITNLLQHSSWTVRM